ncbi:MAG: fibronectin/fibrinogen-binding protein [Firmicutes bacterium]|nr:fibronectin/fibrinogen-binding protein [Bacillota bacterium]
MITIDTFAMNAVALEIKKIIGARVVKIYQPDYRDLILVLRLQKLEKNLYFSVHPAWARIYFSSTQVNALKNPAPFCMKLRKHLNGMRLIDVKHPPLERVISLAFSGRSQEGKLEILWLHAEIMGKHSNLILTTDIQKSNPVILEALKHVTPQQSSIRPVFPGEPYTFPPLQQKLHLFYCTEEQFKNRLENEKKQGVEKALVSSLTGINAFWAKELAARAGLSNKPFIEPEDTEKLWPVLQSIVNCWQQKNWKPSLVTNENGVPFYAAALPPEASYPSQWQQFADMSKAIEVLYNRCWQLYFHSKNYNKLTAWLTAALKKVEKKEALQHKELQKTKRAAEYKLYGELLLAAAVDNKPGSSSISVTNFYKPTEKIEIPLDPSLTVKENGLKYFKLYKKAQKAKDKIAKQLSNTREEITFLKSLLNTIKAKNNTEVINFQNIWQELKWRGYLTAASGAKETTQQKASTPYKFLSSSGIPILAGQNSRQNEYLTFHLARKEDFWLHAKNISGAHVIIRSSSPDQKTLEEAALLAAWLSKARNSSNVAVDYTRARYVKKMPGGKPGQVIYEKFKTLFVTPDKKLFKQLQEENKAL